MSQQFTDESLLREDVVSQGSVECFGMMFENDEARRAYFLAKLREGLEELHAKLGGVPFTTVEDAVAHMQSIEKWPMGDEPRVREIAERVRHAAVGEDLLQRWKDGVGFPHGEIEAILCLSDPPYFTACPNPFISDFIKRYGKPYDQERDNYHREPFAADVSEGRNDDIYTAHTYHTKVPPRAIARYVLHYTSPGDIVIDGFSGAGMTGVGCVLCAEPRVATECGGEQGLRYTILCEISPAATFISSVYLYPPDADEFAAASEKLLTQADDEVGLLWHATDKDGVCSLVEFQVWTEIFTCPLCHQAIVSERVVDATEDIGTAKEFACPHCSGIVSKAPSKASNAARLERRLRSRYDIALARITQFLPRAPIFAQVRRGKKRIRLVTFDEQEQLETMDLTSSYWFPITEVLKGERFELKDYCHAYGITHIHHFYLPRQLITYSCLWDIANHESEIRLKNSLKFFIQSNGLGMTVMNRFGPTHYSQVNKYFSGTLYIPSVVSESSYRYTYESKRKRLISAFKKLRYLATPRHSVTTQSSTQIYQIPNCSVDYIFVDPPFGRNLQYSELNQIWEAWLRIHTNRDPEAIMDATRKREVLEYTTIMRQAFQEMCRILKPGRWITVVFHNSSNAVWLAIQEALMGGGFVIADVRTLSKQRETYKQSRQGLVKQDLVISAYKPNGGLERRFELEAGTEEGVWDFANAHLRQVPVFAQSEDGRAEPIAERMNYLLFDRMVAFHVQRGVTVPLSASQFYAGLSQRFPERDGMYFLPEQVVEYDKKRMTVKEIRQIQLFVTDELSAIQWLGQQLTKKPQTLQELHPQFLRELGGWQKHEKPLELFELLEESFLLYDGRGSIPEQVWSWMQKSTTLRERMKGQERASADTFLRTEAKDRWYVPDPNKAQDLEKLRERKLLREFDEYKAFKGRQLKVFRLEAVRAGFKKAWAEREYQTILDVARKIPEQIVQEDQKLVMWYDQALTRMGGEA